MAWREMYTNDGEVCGLFQDSAFQRVAIKRTRHEARWGVFAVGDRGCEQLIRDGFASEDDARQGFDFDHWSRDRIRFREDDGEWERDER